MRTVHIVIACDTDPDRVGFLDGVTADRLSWRGMTEGIPRLKESLQGLTDGHGAESIITWLLRVDEQIQSMCGSYSWVLEEHGAFLRALESAGDELGWHPHFWRYDDALGRWYQELSDREWQTTMLREAHTAYVDVLPGRARTVRMGWAYHNSETYNTLEQLGVSVECSAIPGLRTLTANPDPRGENYYDWYTAPRKPYFPSRRDCRRPSLGPDDPSSTLIEVPNFTSRSILWGLLAGLQMARKTHDLRQLTQALRRPSYAINITGRPRLFAPLAAQLRKTLAEMDRGPLIFVTYFHPDELLPNRSPLYACENIRVNLESLLSTCDSQGAVAVFSRGDAIPGILSHA